jgi:flagellar motor component MotA
MEEFMIRFLVSLIIFAIGSVSSILLTGTVKTGIIFLDLPSFIIAGVVPFLFVSVLFGFKKMGEAFSTPFKKETDKDKLMQSLIFFKTYTKATWLAGLISVIIGIITMLSYLDDMYKIGPMLALALESLLYCGIINMVIIVPFTIFIKKNLKD